MICKTKYSFSRLAYLFYKTPKRLILLVIFACSKLGVKVFVVELKINVECWELCLKETACKIFVLCEDQGLLENLCQHKKDLFRYR